MILIQQTDATCPKTSFFRNLYSEVITNKHEDVMAKYGAILAQGIIDAGGRNVTVSLQSRTGHTNLQAVVGMLVFTQYWYWFPLAHCLSLAFSPTCVIGLNSELRMPRFEMRSAAKPSLYAYPPPLEEKKAEEREKVATAVLSIAARQKRRETADSKEDVKMEVDEDVKDVLKKATASKEEAAKAEAAKGAAAAGVSTDEPMKETEPLLPKATETAAAAAAADKKKAPEAAAAATAAATAQAPVKAKEPEPTHEILQNPARVLRQQLRVTTLLDNQRYHPMKDISIGGIIVMKHTLPEQAEILVEPVAAYGPKGEDAKEPEAPEPFEYTEE